MRNLLGAATLALIMQQAAIGGTIEISGSGTWDSTAPLTEVSAPNATWSFVFFVPDPLDANPTSMVTDGQYLLNGASITASDPMVGAEFYDTVSFGLFDIFLNSGTTISLYGAQVFDDSTLALYPGIYPATIAPNDLDAPAGDGSGTVVIGSVPEPPSLISGAIAFLMGSVFLARRRHVAQVAA